MLYTNTCAPDKYTIERDGAWNKNHIIEIIRKTSSTVETTGKGWSRLQNFIRLWFLVLDVIRVAEQSLSWPGPEFYNPGAEIGGSGSRL